MNDSQRPEVVVGGRVRQLRQEREWSQEELAERLSREGLTWRQTTVAKTEAAGRPLRVDELDALARVLRVHPAALLEPSMGAEELLAHELYEARSDYWAADKEITSLEEAIAKAQSQVAEAKERRAEADSTSKLIRARLDALRARTSDVGPESEDD